MAVYFRMYGVDKASELSKLSRNFRDDRKSNATVPEEFCIEDSVFYQIESAKLYSILREQLFERIRNDKTRKNNIGRR